ncbi:MAG: TonB-dependent receptor [Gammaproteobacteria bacterium]|nr:TonB-dependent receptor [Gammaproteobacteria bacterium]MBV9620423.1 TonB-dependent receptor [Gammaproteobacteria bacterium]
MKINHQCARAVAAILGTQAGGLAYGAVADTANEAPTVGIQEVVVTAQRRSENAQDVPIAIQAFTADTLKELKVTNFDDLVRYLPNVSAPSAGPGQDQVFMRGLSSGSVATQSGGSISGFPNVAIYLDDQSGQLPGRNLDVYAADLERVEVLEGPQGTLFGAGAQAGVIRYITNKPKLNVVEGAVTGGYSTTAGGDPNSDITAVLNLPVLPDRVALRGVVYNDRRGGYINNVPATFTREPSDNGIHYANFPSGCGPNSPPLGGPPCQVPPGSPVINNAGLVNNAINPVTYQGVRLSGRWAVNDAWEALLVQSYQDIDARGVFYQMPFSSDGAPLPKQSVTLFNPSYNKDRFENTALTIDGRVGSLRLVYAGSYLVRNFDTVQDYTNYARGLYADYYQCRHGAEPQHGLAAYCYSPATTWTEVERNTHQSHELRLSTPDEWRLRGIAGAFWEDLRIYDQLNWNYKTLPPCTASVPFGCLTNIGPPAGASVNDPSTRGDNTAFFNDVKRGYRQKALFTSWDFDLVPKVLTVTAGTRYYHFDNVEKGAVVGSFDGPGCYEAGPAPCLNVATNIDNENLHTTYKGFKSRANLTWHITPDVFVYYTWSQGFRPGAFNRSSGCYIPDAAGTKTYCSPLPYASDSLTNNELGWKTELLNRRVQFNGAVYQEDWKNVQVSFFQPGLLGNVGFNANGPDYRIRGVETSVIAVLTEGLTAQGAASWNSSTQTNSPFLIANNPMLLANPATAAEYGQPLTNIVNPYGNPGSPSANSPPFQFNLRLRYQWLMNNYNLYAQAGAVHTAHSYTQSGANPALSVSGVINTNQLRFETPGNTQYDAALGVARDAWSVDLYGQNLTNVIKSIYTSTAQFALQEEITRPRVIGVKLGYRF